MSTSEPVPHLHSSAPANLTFSSLTCTVTHSSSVVQTVTPTTHSVVTLTVLSLLKVLKMLDDNTLTLPISQGRIWINPVNHFEKHSYEYEDPIKTMKREKHSLIKLQKLENRVKSFCTTFPIRSELLLPRKVREMAEKHRSTIIIIRALQKCGFFISEILSIVFIKIPTNQKILEAGKAVQNKGKYW